MIKEFREFIAKGNVMDMAVGIIIGAAFTSIVNSMVADLINPIVSLFLGGIDFSGLYVLLGSGDYPSIAAAEEAGERGLSPERLAELRRGFLGVGRAS